MLEAYFKKPSRIAKIKCGPLAAHMDAFASQLKQNGYSRLSAQGILCTAGEFNYFLHARNLTALDISTELLTEFTAERISMIHVKGIPNQIDHFVRFLITERVIPDFRVAQTATRNTLSHDHILDRYSSYMRNVRGNSESYIQSMRKSVLHFMKWAFPQYSTECLQQVDGKMLMRYFSSCTGMTYHKIGALRVFCKYLHGEGLCAFIPDVIFPSKVNRKLLSPPKYIQPNEIKAILENCNRDFPDGIRDYTVILMLVTLGLRTQEVANLKIENIDWHNAFIEIEQTKVGRKRTLPLPQVLGKALSDYLLYGRPNSTLSYVFLRHRAPGGHFTAKALYGVIKRTAARAGVALPLAGANVFRHSLATHLINNGTSIKIISDLLDHRSIDTTAIYTMVDLSSMKKVILPLPEVAL